MTHSYHDIAFTPTVVELQRDAGSRETYAAMGAATANAHALTIRETEFIEARDSFYMASVSESGWPYVQHRGGPAGFMKVLDDHSIGFADYSGNRQYVSTGNFRTDDRVSLFFMDYPNRRRLKMLGRVRIVDATDDDTLARLANDDYPVQIERAFIITIEGFDWNCPAHITPRYTEAELRSQLDQTRTQERPTSATHEASQAIQTEAASETGAILGAGPLELVVSGMRQVTPEVRAYELTHANGEALPEFEAGAHLMVPARLAGGAITERHYSIASDPARKDVWEIAVRRDDAGAGGSMAVHQSYHLGLTLKVDPPANHFALHCDPRPSVLIAGGIGITPIKAMAHTLLARGAEFEVHYAARSRRTMAFRDELGDKFASQTSFYSHDEGTRMDLEAILASTPRDAVIYICGPDRLTRGFLQAANTAGIPRDRVRMESFGG